MNPVVVVLTPSIGPTIAITVSVSRGTTTPIVDVLPRLRLAAATSRM